MDISGDGRITKFTRRLFARLIQQSTQTAINTLKHKHVELSGFEEDDLEKHDLMKDIQFLYELTKTWVVSTHQD